MAGRGPRKKKVNGLGMPISPAPTGVGTLPIPAHVQADPVAAACFGAVVGLLATRGDLRPAYQMAIGLLSVEHSRYVAASAIARKTPVVGGTRGPRAHPAAAIAAAAGRTVLGLLQELGLTAASAARIDVPARSATALAAGPLKLSVELGDADLDDLERFQMVHGTDAEKAAVVESVLAIRRLLA